MSKTRSQQNWKTRSNPSALFPCPVRGWFTEFRASVLNWVFLIPRLSQEGCVPDQTSPAPVGLCWWNPPMFDKKLMKNSHRFMVDQLYSISYKIPIQNIWIILCISFPIFTADPCVEVSILILVVYCPVFTGKIQTLRYIKSPSDIYCIRVGIRH